MPKRKKIGKRQKPSRREAGIPALQWMDDEGIHHISPGQPPTPEQLEKMTKEYQKQIRNSPLWDMMVKEFGQKKAEELLKEFQIKIG